MSMSSRGGERGNFLLGRFEFEYDRWEAKYQRGKCEGSLQTGRGGSVY